VSDNKKMNYRYKHTQIGWVMIFCLGAAFIFILFGDIHAHSATVIFLAILLFTMILAFVSLTVSVTADYLNLVFGVGLIRMRIKMSEITLSRTVKNRWWYGFGIHGWWGKGWLLNVSGFDAVELIMKNGMVYRVGTDEPQKLSDVIQEKISRP